MSHDMFHQVKQAVLDYVEEVFDEIEQSMAISHQEKFARLEDSFSGAMDESELKLAFDQWYLEHVSDVDVEESKDEMWSSALSNIEEYAMAEAV